MDTTTMCTTTASEVFESWYDQYKVIVKDICSSKLSGRYSGDLEDVVQKTWEKLWSYMLRCGWEKITDPKSYISAIARNASMEWARQQNERGGMIQHIAVSEIGDTGSFPHELAVADTDLPLIYKKNRELILKYVPIRLKQKEIAVLDLLVEGVSSKEIADQLGICINTVRNRKSSIELKLIALWIELNSPHDPNDGGSPGNGIPENKRSLFKNHALSIRGFQALRIDESVEISRIVRALLGLFSSKGDSVFSYGTRMLQRTIVKTNAIALPETVVLSALTKRLIECLILPDEEEGRQEEDQEEGRQEGDQEKGLSLAACELNRQLFECTKDHVNVGTIGHVDHGKTCETQTPACSIVKMFRKILDEDHSSNNVDL